MRSERDILLLFDLAQGLRRPPDPHGSERQQGRRPQTLGHHNRHSTGLVLLVPSGILDRWTRYHTNVCIADYIVVFLLLTVWSLGAAFTSAVSAAVVWISDEVYCVAYACSTRPVTTLYGPVLFALWKSRPCWLRRKYKQENMIDEREIHWQRLLGEKAVATRTDSFIRGDDWL